MSAVVTVGDAAARVEATGVNVALVPEPPTNSDPIGVVTVVTPVMVCVPSVRFHELPPPLELVPQEKPVPPV
jgi:hypothetical protein